MQKFFLPLRHYLLLVKYLYLLKDTEDRNIGLNKLNTE